MVKRRSMGDAFVLNPEKLAFIHGGEKAMNESGRESVKVKALEVPETLPETLPETTQPEPESPPVPTVKRGRKPKMATQGFEPSPDFSDMHSYEGYPAIWVPLSTRLTPATAEALRRAVLELKLQRRKLHTQQEIVEAAVRHWLESNGFGQAA